MISEFAADSYCLLKMKSSFNRSTETERKSDGILARWKLDAKDFLDINAIRLHFADLEEEWFALTLVSFQEVT